MLLNEKSTSHHLGSEASFIDAKISFHIASRNKVFTYIICWMENVLDLTCVVVRCRTYKYSWHI